MLKRRAYNNILLPFPFPFQNLHNCALKTDHIQQRIQNQAKDELFDGLSACPIENTLI